MSKAIIDSWVLARASNLRRTTAFYQKLGLKPSVKHPSYVEYALAGGTAIGFHAVGHTGRKRTVSKRQGIEGGWGIILRVKNLGRLVAELKRKRIACSPITKAPGGDLSRVFDPDGNRLVLLEMKSP
jgi:catechol 2,3-dioxygenase-like lactoylglutathione lyase family enzyme